MEALTAHRRVEAVSADGAGQSGFAGLPSIEDLSNATTVFNAGLQGELARQVLSAGAGAVLSDVAMQVGAPQDPSSDAALLNDLAQQDVELRRDAAYYEAMIELFQGADWDRATGRQDNDGLDLISE